jgi:hypothetical protein
MTTMKCLTVLFCTWLLAPLPAVADCETDLRGEVFCGAGRCVIGKDGLVWCSRYDRGGATLTLTGEARCGVGSCASNVHGQIFCSSEIGGMAMVDGHGALRCFGRCEPASLEHCENTVADRAGQ